MSRVITSRAFPSWKLLGLALLTWSVLSWLSLELINTHSGHLLVWFPIAVVVGFVLETPRRHWAVVGVMMFFWQLSFFLLYGGNLVPTLIWTAASMANALSCAFGISYLLGGQTKHPRSYADLFRIFMAITVSCGLTAIVLLMIGTGRPISYYVWWFGGACDRHHGRHHGRSCVLCALPHRQVHFR